MAIVNEYVVGFLIRPGPLGSGRFGYFLFFSARGRGRGSPRRREGVCEEWGGGLNSPLLQEIQAFGGRRFSQKTEGNCRLASVTLSESSKTCPNSHPPAQDALKDQNKHVQICGRKPSCKSCEPTQFTPPRGRHPQRRTSSRGGGCANSGRFGLVRQNYLPPPWPRILADPTTTKAMVDMLLLCFPGFGYLP